MKRAWDSFLVDIDNVRAVGELHRHLQKNLNIRGVDLSDLLRIQVVNTFSAFDRLMHEYVRLGLLEQLLGKRQLLEKTKTFSLDTQTYLELVGLGSSPEDEIKKHEVLSRRVTQLLKTMTFQAPNKVSDALSYIWGDPHKWNKIAQGMGVKTEQDLKNRIKLYVERRNQIVHEADYDIDGSRRALEVNDVQDCISTIEELGRQISKLLQVIS